MSGPILKFYFLAQSGSAISSENFWWRDLNQICRHHKVAILLKF